MYSVCDLSRGRTEGTGGMKRHKYGAKPTEIDGIRFASQKEARRYLELKLLEKAGEVRNVELQPKFELHVNTKRIGFYKGDFKYEERARVMGESGIEFAWQSVVEDVKGFLTPVYRLKKRIVAAEYGIEIREV